MDHKIHFSTFSQVEDSTYERFQRIRDRFFEPFCVFLTRLGVKPDHLSYLNTVMLVPFVYFLLKYPVVSLIVLVVSVFLDSLDGCLARHQKVSSERGALLDIASDHAVFFGVVLAFIFSKTIDGFWGATYAMNYFLMVVLVMAMRSAKLHVFPIVRSKYYLYGLWALFIFTGFNFLDIFLVFFSVYMFLTNLFLFHTYRWSLS